MLDSFRHIIIADFEFEFGGHAGNRPRPVCMVAKDLRSGHEWQLWRGEFGTAPLFPIGADSVSEDIFRVGRLIASGTGTKKSV
jgi:DNA polymerase-1